MSRKHLITLGDLSPAELADLLTLAAEIKAKPQAWKTALLGKTLALIFEKPSTRTRVSFEVGMIQLGGHALFLGTDALQIGRGEPLSDSARVLSRYVDGIVARVHSHQSVLDLAANASVSIINGLSDFTHPCQILADYFILKEHFGRLAGLTLAYVGDGNNVCHSLMWGAVKLGVRIRVATPASYEPLADVVRATEAEARRSGFPVPEVVREPVAAVKDADAVYTDVWTSMGQEAESEKRKRDFAGYRVTSALMQAAKPQAIFMHCLPAHRGEEVDAEVIDGAQSIVFDQAESRLHVQKALLVRLLGD
jgi:ornithine carbamoyltransferase